MKAISSPSQSQQNTDIIKQAPLTLEVYFNNHFHNKYTYENFLTCDVQAEYEKIVIKRKNIYKPSDKLKDYLRFINFYILLHSKTNNEVVYSYRKNISTDQAVKKHSASNFFFHTDINDFFNNIKRTHIHGLFIGNISTKHIKDFNIHLDRILDLISVEDCLPAGFPSSPLISNTLLFEFDKKLEQYTQNNSQIYTRYSDDLFVSSQTDNLNQLPSTISNLLTSEFLNSFTLNSDKTYFKKKGEKIKMLGMVILPDGRVTIDKKLKDFIEISLHFYINNPEKHADFAKNHHLSVDQALAKLAGQISYVNKVDHYYMDKLRCKFGNFTIDSFFRKSYK